MDIELYRNFLTIIEAGSLTAAASRLHIAQPALSKQMRVLENHFKTKLIISKRGQRQITLTEAGQTLFEKARYICSLDDQSKLEINNLLIGKTGTLRICVSDSCSATLISGILRDFNLIYPKITYQIHEVSSWSKTALLENSVVELGLFSLPLQPHEKLEVLCTNKEEFMAAFSNSSLYLQYYSEPVISLEALVKLPLSISQGCYELLLHCYPACSPKPNIISLNSNRKISLNWASNNLAVAIITKDAAEILPYNISLKKISGIPLKITRNLVKVKDRPLSHIAEEFVKFYIEHSNKAAEPFRY